jgi:glycine/D-amino acid oxidase-like deaminating enzyme
MTEGLAQPLRQPLERIESDRALPEAADVVVIGGGVAGCCTAWELSRRGVKVVVLEKGIVGGEQSSRNWGWCRQQGRDPRELELARLALEMWPTLGAKIERDLGFDPCGVTFLTHDDSEAATWNDWLKDAHQCGVPSRLLGADEARRFAPGGTSAKWIAGLTTPTDGRAEPARVAPAFAHAVQALGGRVIEGCAVRDIETTAGNVAAVVTERGRIACGAVVVAAGAWTSVFLRKQRIAFPQVHVRGSVARTGPVDITMPGCVSTPYFSLRNREDGGLTIAKSGRGTVYLTPSLLRHGLHFLPMYRVRKNKMKLRITSQFWRELREERAYFGGGASPFEAQRILDPEPDRELLDGALEEVGRVFPGAANLTLGAAWAGMIDFTPDAIPVMSGIPSLPGLFVASGFSGHGFGVAPAVGRVMADLVQGRAAAIDLHPFRYSRMTDGSKLSPYLIF